MLRLIPTVEQQTVLAGAALGRRVFSSWVGCIERYPEPHTVYLDFSGVEVATASFLRESVFAFRDHCRRAAPMLYPVLANLSEPVEDEVEFLATETAEAIWRCDLKQGDSSSPSNSRLIGRNLLDVGQERALSYIENHGEASAPDIARTLSDTVGTTAWNNRLASLSEKGLVVELRKGKVKVFRSVWRTP